MAAPDFKRLKKNLGLFEVFAISTGAMFSSGFFLLPGIAAAGAGPSVVLAYLLAGLLVLPAMLSQAELCTAMPKAGGTYYFLDRSLGPLVGTVGGLGTWLALIFKSSFALVGMGAYLAIFFNIPIQPLAVAFLVGFLLINIFGVKETMGLQNSLVIFLLVILAFFVVFGVFEIFSLGMDRVHDQQFSPFLPFGYDGLFATVGLVFVSYAGLTKVASVAEEVDDPDRNIPLGMALSLLVATIIYVVGVYVMVAVLDPVQLRSDLTPVATAGDAFFDWLPSPTGRILIVGAAVAAFASTGNAGLLSASRYPLAMARDRLVPDLFRRIGRFHTPVPALLLTAGLMFVVVVALDAEGIAKLASAFQLLIFALLNLSVIIMRESHIRSYDPGYRAPLYPWIQIAGLLIPFWLIFLMGALPILFTFGMIGVGLLYYFRYARHRVVRDGAVYHVFERLGRRRFEGLDRELRGILKEKGLRKEDPFDETIASAVVVDLPQDATFDDGIREASHHLARVTGTSTESLTRRFLEGTRMGVTPVSHGAALPHIRSSAVERSEMVLVRSVGGMQLPRPRDAGDGPEDEGEPGAASEASTDSLVHAIFLLVSPEDEPGQHLRILAQIAGRVDADDFLDEWIGARNEQEMKEALLRNDRYLSLRLSEDSPAAALIGRPLRDLDMPGGSLVAIIRRNHGVVIPRGSTVLQRDDRLTILGEPDSLRQLSKRYKESE